MKKGTPEHAPLGPGNSPANAALILAHLLQLKQSFVWIVLLFGDG